MVQMFEYFPVLQYYEDEDTEGGAIGDENERFASVSLFNSHIACYDDRVGSNV
jgi:hypothetical protein